MAQKTVILDVGNVLIHWDPRNLYRTLFDDPAEMEHFLANVTTPDWNLEQDRGRPFADGVALLSARFPEYEDLIRAFDERWPETLGPVIGGTVAILEKLSEQGVRTFGLTNFSAEKWPIFCRLHPFTDFFEGVVVSGEVGMVKPDPLIYQIVIDRFGINPEHTVYVDDRLENVQAAEQLGMIGHHFSSPDKLATDLRVRGFNV